MDDFSLSRLPEPRVYSNEYEAPEFDEIRHGFLLDDQHFLLTTGTFSELAPKGRICPLPDSPVWFAGFINHRGNTVPVYDLPYLVHQERTDLRAQYWILLLGNSLTRPVSCCRNSRWLSSTPNGSMKIWHFRLLPKPCCPS